MQSSGDGQWKVVSPSLNEFDAYILDSVGLHTLAAWLALQAGKRLAMHLLVEKSSMVPLLRMRWKQTLCSCTWLRTWIARRLSPICRHRSLSASQQYTSRKAMQGMVISCASTLHMHVCPGLQYSGLNWRQRSQHGCKWHNPNLGHNLL